MDICDISARIGFIWIIETTVINRRLNSNAFKHFETLNISLEWGKLFFIRVELYFLNRFRGAATKIAAYPAGIETININSVITEKRDLSPVFNNSS